MLQKTNQGVFLKVKVIPKASRTEIVGWENDELKIRVKAVPEKGKANAELIRFLADFLDIAISAVELVQGETSRHKRFCIKQLSLEEIEQKIK